MNVSEVEDQERKSPMVARSTNIDFEKSNLAAKLDFLAGELKTVEKALKDLQDENKNSRLACFQLNLFEHLLETIEKDQVGISRKILINDGTFSYILYNIQ